MRCIRVMTPGQFAAAFAVRMEVFVGEQNVPIDRERDALDEAPTTVHVLALVDSPMDESRPTAEETLGTGRLIAPDGDGLPHIGRVAVVAHARGLGVGTMLMTALEEEALVAYGGSGQVTVALAAQVQAIPFYTSIGYTVHGELFLDAGIWHREATKALKPSAEAHP